MKIINPITGKSYSVKSKVGRQILKKYIQIYLKGGSSGIDVDDLVYPICFEEFDTGIRTPMTSSCGHTFCKECVNKFRPRKVCPYCKESKEWTKNFFLYGHLIILLLLLYLRKFDQLRFYELGHICLYHLVFQ